MKLRHNDLIELRKSGLVALQNKLSSLQTDQSQLNLQHLKRELKDLRAPKLTRRSIAQLHTLVNESKETK